MMIRVWITVLLMRVWMHEFLFGEIEFVMEQ